MEYRGEQSEPQQQQHHKAAKSIKPGAVLRWNQIGQRIELPGKQRQKKPLPRANQGCQENDRKCRMHKSPRKKSNLIVTS